MSQLAAEDVGEDLSVAMGVEREAWVWKGKLLSRADTMM